MFWFWVTIHVHFICVEKQVGFPSQMTLFSPPSKLSRQELRRVILIGSTVGVIAMTLFTTVLFLTLLVLSKMVPYPEIFLVGSGTGNVTADLGPLGKFEMHPEFAMQSKIHLS